MSWFRRSKPQPSPEAVAAVNAAHESFVTAVDDLAAQAHGLIESREIVGKLQAHTAANHYDEWLMDLMMRRAN